MIRAAARLAAAIVATLVLSSAVMAQGTAMRMAMPEFASSPFPYRGLIADKNVPFLDAESGGRRGHTSPRGGIYWEDPTYSDRRALLAIPPSFDISRPGYLVVFFHGNLARLDRDVRDRQQVPAQLAASGLNAVLVAPQFAVDALDSSSGGFWQAGAFARFLDEAAVRLADLAGDPALAPRFAAMPVVLVAYSGGYQAAAFAVAVGGAERRLCGLVLLDAVYAEEERYAAWIARARGSFLFSAYSASSRLGNEALQRALSARGVAFRSAEAPAFGPGRATFLPVPGAVNHDNFVTQAWTARPLEATLRALAATERPCATGG